MIDTKLLRQKILDLAIRGKLVPQDSNDEPASVLLDKIRKEKAALVKVGKIKKDKHESFIFRGDDKHYYENVDGKTTDITAEIPFDIPDGWEWVRLKSICSKIGSGSTPTGGRQIYVPDGIKFLREQNIYNDGLRTDGLAYITDEINKQHNGSQVFARDILMNITGGSIGRTALVDDNFDIANINQHILIIRLIELKMRFFIHRHLLSPYIISLMFDKQTGDKPGLSMEKVARFLMALPPLAEQQRIVSQINHLMTEVDKIDAEAKELDNALSLAKQKVLDLAIRGKLVPQDPNDEPASELLKRIKAEKEALIKAGKIKRDKHESFIFRGDDNRYYEQIDGKTVDITENIPFEIPSSWEWTRLSSICDYGACQSVEPNAIPESAWIVDLEDIEKKSGRLLVRVKKHERQPTSSKHRFFAGNVLYSKLRTYLNKVLVADQDGFCTSEILPLDFAEHMIPEFARMVLMSPMFLTYTNQCGYGVKMPRLGTEDGRKAFIPVPPRSEQKRIVLQFEKILQTITTSQDLE